jgi:hypothetical protein
MVEPRPSPAAASAEFIDRRRRWKEPKMAAYDSVDTAKLFDCGATTELFPVRNRKFNRHFKQYRRFDSAAEARRFALEELLRQLLLGAFLEVEEEPLDGTVMQCVACTTALSFRSPGVP